MDNAKVSEKDASAVDIDQGDNSLKLQDALDEIIAIKRKTNSSDLKIKITDEERMAQLKKYKLLEELKERFQGRVLFEYDEGMETLVKEVIV